MYLVIDQGGHASRALVFDRQGLQQASATQTVSIHRPQSAWVEQDADEVVQSVQRVLADIAEQLGTRCQYIAAAGLATQRSNVLCWDKESGVPLSPLISWQDRRGQSWMRQFDKHRPLIRDITGLLPSAHYGVSKIHWCLSQLSEVQAAHDRGTLACGPLASFLLFRLLKNAPFVVDAVNASRTLLWDRQQRNWSPVLLELFSLTDDYLPRCVANRYPFGELAFNGQVVPMSVCTGDQSAALFAAGNPEQGIAYINVGTGAFVQCVKTTKTAPANLLQSMVWDEGAQSVQVLEATVNGAGSALAAMEKELGISSTWAQSQYAQWLASTGNIPLYLNGISGLAAPFWLADFEAQFVGPQASDAQPWEKMYAVLESIVFLLCLNLEEMRHEGVALRSIAISGGLSVLDGLCQRLADVSNVVVVRAQQTEATAKGLAYLLDNPGQIAANKTAVAALNGDEFLPGANHALHERYQQWRSALLTAVNETKSAAEGASEKGML